MDARPASPADIAFARFGEIIANNGFSTRGGPQISESDTRAKLIDPLFKDVLGWNESEIRREAPAAKGYADYVLGADYPYLHIEVETH